MATDIILNNTNEYTQIRIVDSVDVVLPLASGNVTTHHRMIVLLIADSITAVGKTVKFKGTGTNVIHFEDGDIYNIGNRRTTAQAEHSMLLEFWENNNGDGWLGKKIGDYFDVDLELGSYYDMGFSTIGLVGASDDLIGSLAVPEQIFFHAVTAGNLNNSLALSVTPTTNDYTFNLVSVNGAGVQTVFGSVTFLAGQRIGTFTIPVDANINNEILQIRAHPSNPVDPTLSSITITLRGCYDQTQCSLI